MNPIFREGIPHSDIQKMSNRRLLARTGTNRVANDSLPGGINAAARVVKNSVSLFIAAVLNRGAGLIVAALVARYLGPASLGAYAVVMGFAGLAFMVAPLGQRYVVIRELARDKSQIFPYWLNSSLVTILSALALGIILNLFVHFAGYDRAVLMSTFVVSLFLPIEGLRLIALSVLQGMDRMEYQSVSILIGWGIGLCVFWFLLHSGVGVVAVFIGLGLFQFTAWLILSWAILREAGWSRAARKLRFNYYLCRTTLRASFPFAAQDFLTTALLRVNVMILPMLISLTAIGMFDAADRVRQTSAMIIPLITMAILPTLSRTFVIDPKRAVLLLEKALKLLWIVIFPIIFFIAIAPDEIIHLLYGPGFEAAIPVLRVVIWTQAYLVANVVLHQIMMASDNEIAMVRHSALSLGVIITLTLVLAPRYGPVGVAWATILTQMFNLGLDAQFVARNVSRLNLLRIVSKPLLCATISGGIAFLFYDHGLVRLFLLISSSYIVLLLILRVFSQDELLLARQLSCRFLQKVED
jgi:PST family polysaccharide transporter